MINAFTLTAEVWRATLSRFALSIAVAAGLMLPASALAVPFALTGHRFGPEADNPWLLWTGWLLLLTAALVPAFTALLRRGLWTTGPRGLGLQFGADERRIPVTLALTGVLALTVIGVAFLLFAAFVSALAVASRAAANAPELAVEAAERAPEIGAYFGTPEWIAVIVAGAAFALFSIWFVTRLLLAFPETIRQQKIQAMAALALSRGYLAGVTMSGVVFALIASGAVWALRLVPHGDGPVGLVTLFLVSWAGLTVVVALLAAFLTALDDALHRRQSDPSGT